MVQVVLSLVACLTCALIVGCSQADPQVSTASGASNDERMIFPSGVTFDYQLGGPYTPEADVAMVVRDRTATSADRLYSVCYINGFQTQPGEQDQWPDGTLLTANGEPVADPDWPDEILLDTSTKGKRESIAGIIETWVEGCASAGFEAVEFDNLDSFTRSQGRLTDDDNVALATELADIAHAAGLLVGQKNSAEFTSRLRNDAKFDFAVAEECAAYSECEMYTDVYGDAVIDIEYSDNLPRTFSRMCEERETPKSMILRDRSLVTPDDDGYVFEVCSD